MQWYPAADSQTLWIRFIWYCHLLLYFPERLKRGTEKDADLMWEHACIWSSAFCCYFKDIRTELSSKGIYKIERISLRFSADYYLYLTCHSCPWSSLHSQTTSGTWLMCAGLNVSIRSESRHKTFWKLLCRAWCLKLFLLQDPLYLLLCFSLAIWYFPWLELCSIEWSARAKSPQQGWAEFKSQFCHFLVIP